MFNNLLLPNAYPPPQVPDFYIPPSVAHSIGAQNDGQMMNVAPSGGPFSAVQRGPERFGTAGPCSELLQTAQISSGASGCG